MCEMMEAYGCDVRRARKDHKCCECNGTIKKDEIYYYHHGVLDGSGCGYKICLDCEALRDECDCARSSSDGPIPFEGLHDEVEGIWPHPAELFIKFVEIKRKRGAKIAGWMIERLTKSNVAHEARENKEGN